MLEVRKTEFLTAADLRISSSHLSIRTFIGTVNHPFHRWSTLECVGYHILEDGTTTRVALDLLRPEEGPRCCDSGDTNTCAVFRDSTTLESIIMVLPRPVSSAMRPPRTSHGPRLGSLGAHDPVLISGGNCIFISLELEGVKNVLKLFLHEFLFANFMSLPQVEFLW